MNNSINREKQIEELEQVLLADKTKFYKLEEIENYLKKYNLDNAELFKIVNAMASDKHIFRWFEFINAKIPLLTTHKNFLILLKEVITKVKGDMAQSFFIRALISIGEQDPKTGIALYNQMMMSQDSDLIEYSSFPLG